MSTTEKLPDTTLRIVRVFKAKPERVFNAFTDPEQMRSWFCPEGFRFTEIRVDPKSGLGTYFDMLHEEANQHYVFELDYTTVDRPKKIVWTSTWRDGFADPGRETKATIEFRAVAGGTEVTLTHEGFKDKANRDDHAQGWGSGLDKLAKMLARE
jgi:glutathione S-transferase